MTDSADSGGGNVVEMITRDELDQRVLKLRSAGLSVRRLGREVGLTERQVLEALDRSLPALDAGTRARLFREDLSRLDDLMIHWWGQARAGSATATALVLKIMERRAQLTGSNLPWRCAWR